MTRDDIIARFIDNAAKVSAEPVRVADYAEMNQALERILGDAPAIFCPRITEVEQAIALPAERLTGDFLQASVCVEEVFGGIAETGSVICTSADGKTVQAGLVPLHHVAIVREANIRETLDDFFGQLGSTPPTNVTLETGPSRTADIELTLTIGVHGPAKVSILVIP